jgi:hypothetical protein
VVLSGPVNINIPSTTAGVYLNLVTGVNNPSPGLVPGWDINPWSSTTLNMFVPTPQPAGGTYVGSAAGWQNLTVGTLVSAASTFAAGSVGQNLAFPLNFNSSNNYVGFRFINEANGNQVHYGWAQLQISGTAASQPRAIVQYAYESVAGVGITIPGPGALALIGLAGLTGRGRRRR